ncbi:MAG: hypothetical protein AAGB26_12140 [Planctomycetota bacterium]
MNERVHDDDGLSDTAVLFRLLVGLMGEEVPDYAELVRPPGELRRALRAASTPVLRGLLMDAVAELERRRRGAG